MAWVEHEPNHYLHQWWPISPTAIHVCVTEKDYTWLYVRWPFHWILFHRSVNSTRNVLLNSDWYTILHVCVKWYTCYSDYNGFNLIRLDLTGHGVPCAKTFNDMTTNCKKMDFPSNSWWRHQIKAFSALMALCSGNSPVTGEFPPQRPVKWSFDAFFYLRLNKWLRKQSRGLWFGTPSRSVWRQCNVEWQWKSIIETLLGATNQRHSHSVRDIVYCCELIINGLWRLIPANCGELNLHESPWFI